MFPKPIVFSHTNCKAPCDHARHKTDDQIKALARKTCFNWFVSDNPRSGLDDLINHFHHVRKLVGSEHIRIGSDFSVAGGPGRASDAEWEAHKRIYSEQEWKTIKGRFPDCFLQRRFARRHGISMLPFRGIVGLCHERGMPVGALRWALARDCTPGIGSAAYLFRPLRRLCRV